MRCEICGLDACPRRRIWPDGSKCREYQAARAGLPAPAPIAAVVRPLDSRRLLVLSCDYREPLERGERCACEGELARCWANRSLKSDRTVTRQECEACARERDPQGLYPAKIA